jgi:predicted metal-binding protein
MSKVGIIRCNVNSANCAGYSCFPAIRNHAAAFASYQDEVELVGFDTCGGCPQGKPDQIVEKAKRLKDKGAEVIHLGNCLAGACPWKDMFAESIGEQVGARVVMGTH